MKESTKSGIVSGRYDSMKQRSTLLNGPRKEAYQKYHATLRMEMLLTETVMVTDAQWFDGMFFSEIAYDEAEFGKMLKVCAENQLLSVAYRVADSKMNVVKNMFGKSFYPSAVGNTKLAECIAEIGKDFTTEIVTTEGKKVHVQEPFDELEDYLKYVENQIISMHGHTFDEGWNRYRNGLEKLFEAYKMYPKLFREWGAVFPWQDVLNEKASSIYGDKSYKEFMCSQIDACKTVLSARKPESVPAANKYFELLKSELNVFSNRTKIVELWKKLRNHGAKYHVEDEMEACETAYMEVLNERFNKAFALQHGCRYIEVCENVEKVETLFDGKAMTELVISENTVKRLGTMTWANFEEVLKKLKRERHEWLECYQVQCEQPGKALVLTQLEKYLKVIEEVCESTDIHWEESKVHPWNCHDTNDFEDVLTLKEASVGFVGGGFRPGKDTNEIGILDPASVPMLYRIYCGSNSYDREECLSVIAPVENILNQKEEKR